MPIIQVPRPPWKNSSWVVTCSQCGSSAQKEGADPGEASEFARKEGFSTQIIDIALPLRWLCRTCQDDRTAPSKLNGQSKLNHSTLIQKGN